MFYTRSKAQSSQCQTCSQVKCPKYSPSITIPLSTSTLIGINTFQIYTNRARKRSSLQIPDLASHCKQQTSTTTQSFAQKLPPNPNINQHPTSIYPDDLSTKKVSSTFNIHLMSLVKQQHRHSILPKMDYFRTLTQRSASETRVGDRVRVIFSLSVSEIFVMLV